jgi:hypothetical protein
VRHKRKLARENRLRRQEKFEHNHQTRLSREKVKFREEHEEEVIKVNPLFDPDNDNPEAGQEQEEPKLWTGQWWQLKAHILKAVKQDRNLPHYKALCHSLERKTGKPDGYDKQLHAILKQFDETIQLGQKVTITILTLRSVTTMFVANLKKPIKKDSGYGYLEIKPEEEPNRSVYSEIGAGNPRYAVGTGTDDDDDDEGYEYIMLPPEPPSPDDDPVYTLGDTSETGVYNGAAADPTYDLGQANEGDPNDPTYAPLPGRVARLEPFYDHGTATGTGVYSGGTTPPTYDLGQEEDPTYAPSLPGQVARLEPFYDHGTATGTGVYRGGTTPPTYDLGQEEDPTYAPLPEQLSRQKDGDNGSFGFGDLDTDPPTTLNTNTSARPPSSLWPNRRTTLATTA